MPHKSPKVLNEVEWNDIRSKATTSSDGYALFSGDAYERLRQLPAESINTCLTSPPYWAVRDYSHENQLGLENKVDDYINKLTTVFREVYRVLSTKGTVWLNVGDSRSTERMVLDACPSELLRTP